MGWLLGYDVDELGPFSPSPRSASSSVGSSNRRASGTTPRRILIVDVDAALVRSEISARLLRRCLQMREVERAQAQPGLPKISPLA
jgi:hypothetical protein